MNLQEVQENIGKLQISLSGGNYLYLKRQICDALIMEIIYAHRHEELNVHEYPVLHSLIEASHMADIVQGVITFDHYKEFTANQEYGIYRDNSGEDKGISSITQPSMQTPSYIKKKSKSVSK